MAGPIAAERSTKSEAKTSRAKTKRIAVTFDRETFLSTVGAGRRSATYDRGQPIFRQGDPADAVFYIESGKIQISLVSEQGKEGVIAMLGAGEFFGEGCLVGQPLHLATSTALDECTIVRIEKEAMIRELNSNPEFSKVFTAFLLLHNAQIEADLVDHLFNSSEKRLARVLLMLAHFGKDGKLELVIPPVNQELLAARVGTTRSRINFFMNKFRKLGFIEYNGHLKVHSSLLNVIVHD
ncbi:MAG: Crp/Fnr family transcriptional regulator [Rhodospirillaceae bacterium]|nr:Crp/Fnr family transcriptional regulator [Rhodospirillaceae bacterium]